MNLKRVSIRNEILIRDVSIINSISCKHELNLKCRSGLKLSLDSRKLPLAYLIFNPDDVLRMATCLAMQEVCNTIFISFLSRWFPS